MVESSRVVFNQSTCLRIDLGDEAVEMEIPSCPLDVGAGSILRELVI